MATVSRIDIIIGFFVRIVSLLQGSFAKQTYNFIDPSNQSHPVLTPDICVQKTQMNESDGKMLVKESLLQIIFPLLQLSFLCFNYLFSFTMIFPLLQLYFSLKMRT